MFDFEFTCCSLNRKCGELLDGEIVTLYGPKMQRFLRALERVEKKKKTALQCKQPSGPSFSTQKRDSWTGRVWFDYTARKSFKVDIVYWAALHEDGAGVELHDKARVEMESFTQIKMEQLKAYKEECTARFASGM